MSGYQQFLLYLYLFAEIRIFISSVLMLYHTNPTFAARARIAKQICAEDHLFPLEE